MAFLNWIKNILIPLALFPLLTTVGLADVEIPDQALVYSVSYGSKNVGQVEIVIRNESDGYVLTSTTRPSKLAGLFLKEHTSDTRFIRRDGELVPDSANEKLEGKKSYDRGFQFNYDNNQIEFSEGNVEAFEDGEQFESVTFPLLLMHRPIDSIEGMVVREVSPKRLRSYTYNKPTEDTVKVPAGEYSAWKITRFRTDKPEDTVTVWLDQSDNPVPVKIEIFKKGKKSTMNLTGN